MKKVLCFGELLLRFSPPANGEWLLQHQMPVFVGGAELNVATALAKWGVPAKYFTVLPDTAISKNIVAYVAQKQIDSSAIVYTDGRLGIYYLSTGTDMKSAHTVFDRKDSSFSIFKTGQLNWDQILEDVSWFHFTAIAPALSETAAALCKEALHAASQRNIKISVDLNYRALLWKYGKRPTEVMPELVQYCDVVMGNIWSAHALLGINLPTVIAENPTQADYLTGATVTASRLFKDYPRCQYVANTFRFDSQQVAIQYYAALNTKDAQFVSPLFRTAQIVDKVGSGDCFMAGLIYGIINNHSLSTIITYAAAAAFGKLQEKGDTTNNDVSTIQHIANQFLN
ncbi:MAG: PfkB family carbohydrate kinase [Bacteroidota bacterium]|jgi:2-dehydro-3-deoxygluconokinase